MSKGKVRGQDFVTLEPSGGSVTAVKGKRVFKCAKGETLQVTRGEWDVLLKKGGAFKIVTKQDSQEAPKAKDRKTGE